MHIHIFENAISRTFKCKSKYYTLNSNFSLIYKIIHFWVFTDGTIYIDSKSSKNTLFFKV